MAKGTLYLLPTGLGGEVLPLLPEATQQVLRRLDHFIAENPKTARAFLKAADYGRALQDVTMEVLDEHTPDTRLAALLEPLQSGRDCGLLSEAGCPAVADPGAGLVRSAHAAGIRVVPLVGPSALLLALMASGLNGQRFCFQGYLPVDRAARAKRLKEIEDASEAGQITQLFIEAPYRNDVMLKALLEGCRGDTLLCIATDLTQATESVHTRTISDWKRAEPAINRRPTVFLLYRQRSRGQKR